MYLLKMKYMVQIGSCLTRAVNVLRYFVETKKQNPVRFTAAGYGEYRPIAQNNSDVNKAKNRRVNIVIVSKEKESSKK